MQQRQEREALRIMSVPDSYVIPGTVKLSHQYRLTGNGVPYLLGKALARSPRTQLLFALDNRAAVDSITAN